MKNMQKRLARAGRIHLEHLSLPENDLVAHLNNYSAFDRTENGLFRAVEFFGWGHRLLCVHGRPHESLTKRDLRDLIQLCNTAAFGQHDDDTDNPGVFVAAGEPLASIDSSVVVVDQALVSKLKGVLGDAVYFVHLPRLDCEQPVKLTGRSGPYDFDRRLLRPASSVYRLLCELTK